MENPPVNAVNNSIGTNMDIGTSGDTDFTPVMMAVCIPILLGIIIHQSISIQPKQTMLEGLEILGVDVGQMILDYVIDPMYEGLGIKKIVDDILGLVNSVTNIFDMIACPFRILNNIDKCIPFWLIDLLLYIIWRIVWIFTFVTMYLPLLISTKLLILCGISCEFMMAVGFPESGCHTLKPDDVIPSKETIGRYLEEFILYVGGKHFFYRTDDEMDKCYCIPGIEKACDPLRVTGIGTRDDKKDSSNSRMTLIWAICIILLLAIGNASKPWLNQNISTGKDVPGIPELAVGVPIVKGVPIVEGMDNSMKGMI
jgi:hypothetical protein